MPSLMHTVRRAFATALCGCVLIAAAARVGSAQAAASSAIPPGQLQSAELWFDAKATLGAFRGITKTARGEMSGGASLAVVRGFVEYDATTMTTNNGMRDRDMRKTLEVEKFKTIRFDLDSVSVGSETADSTKVELVGRMLIHGVTKQIRVPATVRRAADHIRVTGAFPVVLPQYGVTKLTRMLGTLRMNELIQVGLDVTFQLTKEEEGPQ
ncbi:MAG TPA: YceI family protein [Gemmatimonadaceae bacterium]|nr:YceI family protein [Gemmatimonadaceae bacterium]